MKIQSLKFIAFSLLFWVFMLGLFYGLNTLAVKEASAQKVGKQRLITSADLDHAFVQGATVKYQLTDQESNSRPIFYSNGTVLRRLNAVVILDYTDIDGRRDDQGRKLFRVKIDRPDFLGGPFEKDAPFDPARDPGSIDTLQPGDLVN